MCEVARRIAYGYDLCKASEAERGCGDERHSGVMVIIFRFIVLLIALAAIVGCQSAKSTPEADLAPGSPELEQLYQEGRAAYFAEEYQTAAEIFARVVDNDPEHLKALINWGVALSRGGNPKDAIPKFEQALSRDPNHAEAIYNLGTALQRLGEHEAAVAQYQKAVALNPAISTPQLQRYLERMEPRRQDSQISQPDTSSTR